MDSDSRISVLQTIRQGIIGGGESHVISLVKNINKDLFRPVVLSFTDGPMVKTLIEMDIPVYIIPTTTPFDFRIWEKVYLLLMKEKIKIVHAHGTRAASNVYKACQKRKIPLAYTIHGWSFHNDQSFLVKKIRIASEQFITRRTTFNVSVSKANQQSGINNLRNFSSVLIRYGIDMDKFNPNKQYPDIRKKLGIKNDTTLIGFIARMTYQKNPLKMIQAFGAAAVQCPDIHLLMVGEGELKEATINTARQLGIMNRISFLNFSQDVPSILNACDIYCLPSFWEGLPIGLLEAMAMGKAVIAAGVDGTVEVIENGKNGFLINPHAAHEITKAILELHYNSELMKKFQFAAKETIRSIYVDKLMIREIEKLYMRSLSYSSPQQFEIENTL